MSIEYQYSNQPTNGFGRNHFRLCGVQAPKSTFGGLSTIKYGPDPVVKLGVCVGTDQEASQKKVDRLPYLEPSKILFQADMLLFLDWNHGG